ncbi:valine dehydrogenase-like isoform X2 [Mya arenaria]|uniref:valine dehydrogenase-like isoform X2 n=1 Tax=Mya arenaria TaxID=6604 RepID=UPI0022E17E9C|nr:valine dehydrogenase-like isoform X2 [Mya arenaria]
MKLIFRRVNLSVLQHVRQLSFQQYRDLNSFTSRNLTLKEQSVTLFRKHRQTPRLHLKFSTNTGKCSEFETLSKCSPTEFLNILQQEHIERCFISNLDGQVKCSHKLLSELFPTNQLNGLEYEHDAIFFEKGHRTGCLLSVFLWKTNRGQGIGGVDFRPKTSMAELIKHGCRFSKALGVKCALAGMWVGGGKGLISFPDDTGTFIDPEFRRQAFMDFGDFLSSLNGCFIAGSGIGSSVEDMDTMFMQTRYVSNLSPDYGGSANAYHWTARGVVKAMEAALVYLGMGTLRGKYVAIQGGGRVAEVIIGELLQNNAAHIYVSEVNSFRVEDLRNTFPKAVNDGTLTIKKVSHEDTSIYRHHCDIFSPCARGMTLDKHTIPMLDTKIICGSSNLPVNMEEDYAMLKKNNILYVTDVIPNRMGIVSKSLELYGRMENDPEFNKHLSYDWEHSIYQTTLQILKTASEKNINPLDAAYLIGQELSKEHNPLFPGRTHDIIRGLMESGWYEGKDFWKDRFNYGSWDKFT